MNFINKICCCIGLSEYSKLPSEDPDNSLDYNDFDQIQSPKSVVLTCLKNQNVIELASVDLYNILYVINELSSKHFEKLNLSDHFLIDLYQNLLIKNSAEQNTISIIMKKLITLKLFFCCDISNQMIAFLKNKIFLFDYKLFLGLILDKEYSNDNDVINIIILLNNYKILPLFKPINYYGCDFSIFEYIILGKLEYQTNKLKHIRFFDLEAIINLIDKTNSTLYLNQTIIQILTQLKNNKNLNYKYLDTVIELLSKRCYQN